MNLQYSTILTEKLQMPNKSIPSCLIVFIYAVLMLNAGHGTLPQLTGNVSEVLVSSLLQSCYLSSQTLPRVYQHYGPSPIQPLSAEMQILLTVYYLVQLGQYRSHRWLHLNPDYGGFYLFVFHISSS